MPHTVALPLSRGCPLRQPTSTRLGELFRAYLAGYSGSLVSELNCEALAQFNIKKCLTIDVSVVGGTPECLRAGFL
jgi:hypothetical protein